MSHSSGGQPGGHHGSQGGHPSQGSGWSSALKGGQKPITSLPNPTVVPIFFALFVFVIMLLPFVINWDEGIELPWVTTQREAAEKKAKEAAAFAEALRPDGGDANSLNMNVPVASVAGEAAVPISPTSTAGTASIDQQLMFASQQGFGGAPAAQPNPSPFAGAGFGQGGGLFGGAQTQQAMPYQGEPAAMPARRRVWVER